MTNKEAIKELITLANNLQIIPSSSLGQAMEMALEILMQGQKTEQWISVSERLPENSGVYIVSKRFTDGFEERILTDACYFDGTSTWHDDNRVNHGREYADKKIVAWMPLPEPDRRWSEVSE